MFIFLFHVTEFTKPSEQVRTLATQNNTMNEFKSFFSTLQKLLGCDGNEISPQENHSMISQNIVIDAVQQVEQPNQALGLLIGLGENGSTSQTNHGI